ncbi:MAG: aldo/keto reductase [Bryobacteraceae bacterium]|nr:aldo/keto reductase [Bryobacteraceae bacterium]
MTLAAGDALAQNTGEIPRRKLGRTGESVSCVGLGGFHIGEPKDLQTSTKIIRTAIDSGINFMDNCWDYHDGKSEDWMGQALANGYRSKVYLMSKIDGRDKKTAAKQIEESLKRLLTDRIDLMQMHEIIRPGEPEQIFRSGGAMEALVEAQKAGKVRHIGFTGHKDPKIHLATLKVAAARNFQFDTVQMPLNVMDAHYNSFEKMVLPELVKQNIGVLGMKPLGGGEILKSSTTSAEDCLRYALNLPTSVVISGCETLERLQQLVKVARSFQKLDQTQVNALLAKTRDAAQKGQFELYKTSEKFDGTTKNPQWLG